MSPSPSPEMLAAEARGYRGRVVRIVEAQHRISTSRLAADTADQQMLEALADAVKPDLPEAARRLPWLLAAPFRYGLGRPSRFRAADVLPGIFYAAEDIATAVAEAAYWRLKGFSRSPGFLRPRTPTPMSAFSVRVAAARAVDLTAAPFADPPDRWTGEDYAPTQRLADAARRAAIVAIRAPSARHAGGVNLAVLDAGALVPPPRPHSSWAFLAIPGDGLLVTREMSDEAHRFSAAGFGIS